MTMKTFALAAALSVGMSAPMFAQEADVDAAATTISATGQLTLELNKTTELEGGACRLAYVAQNGTDTDVEKASYEMVIFDDASTISSVLLMDFVNLGAGKTRVIQFDIADQSCAGISEILVNSQVDCATANGASDMCTANLATRALMDDITFTH